MTEPTQEQCISAVCALVEEVRPQCLWCAKEDFVPRTPEAALRALGYIEKYGDRAAFDKAIRLKQWLLHPSNATSAV